MGAVGGGGAAACDVTGAAGVADGTGALGPGLDAAPADGAAEGAWAGAIDPPLLGLDVPWGRPTGLFGSPAGVTPIGGGA